MFEECFEFFYVFSRNVSDVLVEWLEILLRIRELLA
jgi:hypothetical protein